MSIYVSAVKEISDFLKGSVILYKWNEVKSVEDKQTFCKNLTMLLAEASSDPPKETEKLSYTDRILYIYTSGTTGLPKAAVITGAR